MADVISVRHNFADIAAQLDRLADQVADRVMVRTVNATVDQARTDMAREIAAKYRLSIAEAKRRLAVVRASARRGALHIEATLRATSNGKGRSMNLVAFVERSVTLAQARRRIRAGEGGTHTLRNGGQIAKALELRFQIKRAGGKKVIPGAFIGNQGRTVFIRTGKDRLPIKALSTIDVPQMFNARDVNAAVRRAIAERLPKNFRRELRAVTGGWVR